MKIRVMGTFDECEQAKEIILRAFHVVEISGLVRNRPPSALFRVYIETRMPPGDGHGEPGPAAFDVPALPPPRTSRRRSL